MEGKPLDVLKICRRAFNGVSDAWIKVELLPSERAVNDALLFLDAPKKPAPVVLRLLIAELLHLINELDAFSSPKFVAPVSLLPTPK